MVLSDADFTVKVLLTVSLTEDHISSVTVDILSKISVTKALGTMVCVLDISYASM